MKIEEALYQLKQNIKMHELEGTTSNRNEREKALLDYITNLQEENERLKNRLELYNNALNEKTTEFKTKETPFEDLLSIKVLQKMLRLEDRIEELEIINEEHRKINGELRKTINKAIEFLDNEEYYITIFYDNNENDNKKDELLEILKGKSDE